MINYTGSNRKMKSAVKIANKILNNQMFYMGLKSQKPADGANITNELMASLFKQHRDDNIQAIVFTPWNRCFSKVRGRFQPSKPNSIQISACMLKKNTPNQIASVLCHELTHYIDNIYPEYTFGHSGNSKHGNEASMPYLVNLVVDNILKS
jgi:hypothetical protein